MTEEHDILIYGLKQGNREVFDQIFRCYYTSLAHYCMKFVSDKDKSEEIVQDVFVKLWLKHETVVINNSLKSYLFKATQNLAFNYIRNAKHTIILQDADIFSAEGTSDDPSISLEENDLKDKIQKIIQLMPTKRREVFLLSRTNGLRNAEIARRLNISVKTVETHMSKALNQLRKALQKHSILLLLLSFFIK